MILDPLQFVRARQDDLTPSIRLVDARLCPDCELLFTGPTCPGCAGRSWWPLASHLCKPATPARRPRRPRRVAAPA